MLHKDILMADIDVDQWRNVQALLLHSAKAARRIVVIHDGGRVVKCRHTGQERVADAPEQVSNPHLTARQLYEANSAAVDFVVVMEREAVDRYFADIQDSWDIDEDLDVFVQRTYATLDQYSDGIVTYPGRARDTLGMQWRTGASRDQLATAVAAVPNNTVVVLGVHGAEALWASLVLDVGEGESIVSVTTVDPSLVDIRGARTEVLDRVVSWIEASGRVVSYAISADRAAVDAILAADGSTKLSAVLDALADGALTVTRGAPALIPG